jgi:hypothetical protein
MAHVKHKVDILNPPPHPPWTARRSALDFLLRRTVEQRSRRIRSIAIPLPKCRMICNFPITALYGPSGREAGLDGIICKMIQGEYISLGRGEYYQELRWRSEMDITVQFDSTLLVTVTGTQCETVQVI